MDIAMLYKSAEGLVDNDTFLEEDLLGVSQQCATELTQVMKSHEDVYELVGEGNISLMEMNHENHCRYMASLCSMYEPVSFVEIVIWVLRTYQSRGFDIRYWKVMLPEARKINSEIMPQEATIKLDPVYLWLEENLDALNLVSKENHSFFEKLTQLFGGEHEQSVS